MDTPAKGGPTGAASASAQTIKKKRRSRNALDDTPKYPRDTLNDGTGIAKRMARGARKKNDFGRRRKKAKTARRMQIKMEQNAQRTLKPDAKRKKEKEVAAAAKRKKRKEAREKKKMDDAVRDIIRTAKECGRNAFVTNVTSGDGNLSGTVAVVVNQVGGESKVGRHQEDSDAASSAAAAVDSQTGIDTDPEVAWDGNPLAAKILEVLQAHAQENDNNILGKAIGRDFLARTNLASHVGIGNCTRISEIRPPPRRSCVRGRCSYIRSRLGMNFMLGRSGKALGPFFMMPSPHGIRSFSERSVLNTGSLSRIRQTLVLGML